MTGAGKPAPFGARLAAAVAARGPLCAGIDPHAGLLAAWGLPDSASGAQRLGTATIGALAGEVAAVKIQSAFFERFGAAGVGALETVLAAARDAGVLAILDAKRGDIGSTMGAYAEAYLADDAPLRADALTVSPYLGLGSLDPAFELADATGRGLYVLALTSNREAAEVQHAAVPAGGSLGGEMISQVSARNPDVPAGVPDVPGSHGVVIGATVGGALGRLGIDLNGFTGTILAPGYGAQGASAADIAALFGPLAAAGRVLVPSSRGILAAGPDPDALRQAARESAQELATAFAR